MLVLLLVIGCSGPENDFVRAAREYQKGNFDAAMAMLDRFEKSSPPTVDSLDLRGCIAMEQKEFDEARKAFERAHAANPEIFAPRLHLGDLLMRQKKFAEAREVYQKVLKETNILMWNERLRFVVLLTYLGERDEPAARYTFDAITFPTETPAYYYAQAAWAFAHDKKSEANDWLKKARKVFDAEATLWFARHLYEFGWLKSKPPLSIYHG